MKCPECQAQIHFDGDTAKCTGGHQFHKRHGVFSIITIELASRLYPFLDAFEQSRSKEISEVRPEMLRKTPYVDENPAMWKLRQYDLELVKRHLRKTDQTALEIGAWHGWLTHHLAASGLKTVAIDYFTHPLDGLGAIEHYTEEWEAYQIDLEHPEILDRTFDIIVVNRCLPYYEAPEKVLELLSPLLNPGGRIIFTGLTLLRNPAPVIAALHQMSTHFEKHYCVPFYFKKYLGYNTRKSLNALKTQGLQLHIYPELKLPSLVGKIYGKKPVYYYGIFEKTS